jgi:hypothetical protein
VTEENDYPTLGENDWTQMEQLANGVDAEDIDSPQFEQMILSEDMITKRVLWDVAPHSLVEDVSDFLGLPKTSNEGFEMEHAEAHARQQGVGILIPVLEMLSKVSARSIFATMLVSTEQTDEVTLDGEEFEDNVDKLEAVMFASALSMVGQLVDWGLVHTPHIIPAESMDELREMMQEAMEEDEDSGE